ncbi:thioredoxin family protein [Gemmatimonadota bacterium]
MVKSFSDGSTPDKLAELVEPVEIVVFTAEGCPNCPHTVRAASALAAANSMVTVTVLDTADNAELASRYQVRSVPTAVVNGDLTIIGVVTQEELLSRLVDLQGCGADNSIFVSLVKSGRLDDATARLVDGRGISAFAELWNESTLEGRIGLSLCAQNALDDSAGSLDGLVDLILPSLATDDAARRGDTADLLGAIGHESARSALEKLMGDGHPDVAEAAEDALASIEERARASG